MSLIKETKDLFNENFQSLRKEIKEDIKRWKDTSCLWSGRINARENGHLDKSYLQIQYSAHWDSHDILQRNEKKHTKIHMEPQKILR